MIPKRSLIYASNYATNRVRNKNKNKNKWTKLNYSKTRYINIIKGRGEVDVVQFLNQRF